MALFSRGRTGAVALERVLNGWSCCSPRRGPFWDLQFLLKAGGGVWPWKRVTVQEKASPTRASVSAEIAGRASNYSFVSYSLVALPADLLPNSPIKCPEPPTSPMQSEKQANTVVQQWRQKFALSISQLQLELFFVPIFRIFLMFQTPWFEELWATAVGAVLWCCVYFYLLRYL